MSTNPTNGEGAEDPLLIDDRSTTVTKEKARRDRSLVVAVSFVVCVLALLLVVAVVFLSTRAFSARPLPYTVSPSASLAPSKPAPSGWPVNPLSAGASSSGAAFASSGSSSTGGFTSGAMTSGLPPTGTSGSSGGQCGTPGGVIRYPIPSDCVHVLSSLQITTPARALTGLAQVERIDGALSVKRCPHLETLGGSGGLINVRTIRFGLVVDVAGSLTSLDGLHSLLEFGGALSINHAPSLYSISALGRCNISSLQSIGVGGTSLRSLFGLQSLRSLPSSLVIQNNPLLEDISSLGVPRNNELLESVSALQNACNGSVDIFIVNNTRLTSLEGLECLTISSSIAITDNVRLFNLSALGSMDQEFDVTPISIIVSNSSAAHIPFGFRGAVSSLEVIGNPLLTTVSGLARASGIFNELILPGAGDGADANPHLSNMCALMCSLTAATGPMQRVLLHNFQPDGRPFTSLADWFAAGRPCAEGPIYCPPVVRACGRANQVLDYSDLPAPPAACVHILGSLRISNIDSTQLDHLQLLETIDEVLYVQDCDSLVSLGGPGGLTALREVSLLSVSNCPKLTSLSGDGALANLSVTQSTIVNNCAQLSTLGGLTSLSASTVALSVSNCPRLATLNGLTSPVSCLSLVNNTGLTDLTALRLLARGHLDYLEISGCSLLPSLEGLESVNLVGPSVSTYNNCLNIGSPLGLTLRYNDALTNVSAIAKANVNCGVTITNNSALETLHLSARYDYIDIAGNPSLCAVYAQIISALTLADLPALEHLILPGPNPLRWVSISNVPRLQQLPDLHASANASVQFSMSGAPLVRNLSVLSGLHCFFRQFVLENNAQLTELATFQPMDAVQLPWFTISGCPRLTTLRGFEQVNMEVMQVIIPGPDHPVRNEANAQLSDICALCQMQAAPGFGSPASVLVNFANQSAPFVGRSALSDWTAAGRPCAVGPVFCPLT